MKFGNKKKAVAWLLLAAALLTMALSEQLIAHRADHDCTGDGCPVCRAIRTLDEMAVCVLLVAAAHVAFAAARTARQGEKRPDRASTPISLCVKLTE